MDVVEELCDVNIHHPVLPFPRILLCGLPGVLCAAPRSKSVTVLAELWIEDRCHTCNNSCCMNRSCTVGMPNMRVPPLGLGISTRLTGLGT